MQRTLYAVGITTLCLSWGVPALAAATAAQRCEAAKLKAAGKNAACRTRALAQVAIRGEADLGACSTKFASAFAKLDAKGGCATTGDAAVIESRIDTVTDSILTNLSGACAPRTCSDGGGSCGIISDGCGGTIDCGLCESACSTDADCINTRVCRFGICEPKLSEHRPCIVENDCLSECCCNVGVTNCVFYVGDTWVVRQPGVCTEPADCSVSGNEQCPGASGPPSDTHRCPELF
jgi:hypothetical protein